MTGTTNFPDDPDVFSTTTPVYQGTEDSTGRTHSERHDDMAAAMMAVQANAGIRRQNLLTANQAEPTSTTGWESRSNSTVTYESSKLTVTSTSATLSPIAQTTPGLGATSIRSVRDQYVTVYAEVNFLSSTITGSQRSVFIGLRAYDASGNQTYAVGGAEIFIPVDVSFDTYPLPITNMTAVDYDPDTVAVAIEVWWNPEAIGEKMVITRAGVWAGVGGFWAAPGANMSEINGIKKDERGRPSIFDGTSWWTFPATPRPPSVSSDCLFPEGLSGTTTDTGNWDGLELKLSGTGAAASPVTALDEQIGVIAVSTGTTTTGRCGIASGPAAIKIGGDYGAQLDAYVALPTLSNGTETFAVIVGFADTVSSITPTTGVFFRYQHSVYGGNWQCVSVDGGTETVTDSGILVEANVRYHLHLESYGEWGAQFKIAEQGYALNSVGFVDTNYPTAATRIVPVNIIKSAGTTARAAHIDWFMAAAGAVALFEQ